MTTAIVSLNPAALVALASCEQRIERGLKTFIDVGQALAEIRDSRLYKGSHETFEDYCRDRWGFSRQRAQQFTAAAELATTMVDTGLPTPTNERQTRELAKVPEPERADVWRETVERTEGKPTAAAIREVHEERTRPPFPGPADPTTPPTDPGTTPECLGVDMDCGRPLPCPDHPAIPGMTPAPAVAESPALAAPQEPDPIPEHDAAQAWKGDEPGSCGVECLCGVVFDGFDTLAEAAQELKHHIETPEPDAVSTAPSGPGLAEVASTREGDATSTPATPSAQSRELAEEIARDSERRTAVSSIRSVLTYLTSRVLTPEQVAGQYAQALAEFTAADLVFAAKTMAALAALKEQ